MKLADLIGRRVPRRACVGTLAAWSNIANMLFAPGCEAQGFALMCSFAAPLMSLFPTPEGGAVVSLTGGRKAGKTTALTAAATVWGLPQDYQLVLGVGEAKFARLVELGNLPATCLTLTNHDPSTVEAFIHQMLVSKQPLPWQTILIAASATSLKEQMGVWAQGSLGVPDMVLELPLAVPKGLRREKDRNAQVLIANRGNAGHAYLSALAWPETVKWAKMQLLSKYLGLKERYGLDDALRFPARAIAAVHIASILVTQNGLLEFDPDRIANWAAEQAFAKPAAPRP